MNTVIAWFFDHIVAPLWEKWTGAPWAGGAGIDLDNEDPNWHLKYGPEWKCKCPYNPEYDKSINPYYISYCGLCGTERPYAPKHKVSSTNS